MKDSFNDGSEVSQLQTSLSNLFREYSEIEGDMQILMKENEDLIEQVDYLNRRNVRLEEESYLLADELEQARHQLDFLADCTTAEYSPTSSAYTGWSAIDYQTAITSLQKELRRKAQNWNLERLSLMNQIKKIEDELDHCQEIARRELDNKIALEIELSLCREKISESRKPLPEPKSCNKFSLSRLDVMEFLNSSISNISASTTTSHDGEGPVSRLTGSKTSAPLNMVIGLHTNEDQIENPISILRKSRKIDSTKRLQKRFVDLSHDAIDPPDSLKEACCQVGPIHKSLSKCNSKSFNMGKSTLLSPPNHLRHQHFLRGLSDRACIR